MRKIVLFLFFVWSYQSMAQLDNQAFFQKEGTDSLSVGRWQVFLDQFSFCKNNEYFSTITDGYTLFGTHLIPSIQIQVHPRVRLEAGVFLWKDFGSSGFRDVQPVFSFRYLAGGNELRMGSLNGGLAHNLIEPLYNFENQMLRRLEYGFQWKHKSRFLELETWVDWRNMIQDYSPTQEQVEGGLTASSRIFQGENAEFSLKTQATAFHLGGQIDTTQRPLTTWFNGALGFQWLYDFEKDAFIRRIDFQGYVLGFKDHSQTRQYPFKQGWAHYSNVLVKTYWLDFILSYWQGNDFSSFIGGKIYRGYGSNISHPGYQEKRREILIFRCMRDFELAPNLYITARLEPYFDLRNNLWEYAYGLYFTYRGNLWQRNINPN